MADVVNVRFYSNELLNLHHTLYAAAWAGRTQGRVLSRKLPHPLVAPFTTKERAVWDEAVHYYDAQIADREPLNGRGMQRIKEALVTGKLDDPAIDKELRATLEAAEPVFRRYFWPEQDHVNRAWIASIIERVTALAPDVIPRLEKTYDAKWFSAPVRADAVWVGHWGSAYTGPNPPHSVLSSTDPFDQDWSGAETVYHEFSHVLVDALTAKVNEKLGDTRRQHGTLCHAILFYLTGEVVRETLARRNVDYQPVVYSTNLFSGVWRAYRKPIEDVWEPYLLERYSMDDAIAKTVSIVTGRK